MTRTLEEALRSTEAIFDADPDHQRSVQEVQIRNAHDFIAWTHELDEALRNWRGPDDALSSGRRSELASADAEPAPLPNSQRPLDANDVGHAA
jgi:hypothetical protein